MQRTIGRAVTTIFLLTVAGCGGGIAPVRTEVVPYTAEQQVARKEAEIARYRLRSGDHLGLTFKFEKELNQQNVLVLPDGYISPVGIGHTVQAAGLTIDELNEILTTEYGRDYRNPELSIVVAEIALPEVYVLGMVRSPGLFKLPTEGTGVIQAVAQAGGFADDADRSQVTLMRAGENGFVLRALDLNHLEKVGFGNLEVFDLQPYDVIYVPRSGMGDFKYFVDGVFGSSINVSRFFWDIYAIANLDKVQSVIR